MEKVVTIGIGDIIREENRKNTYKEEVIVIELHDQSRKILHRNKLDPDTKIRFDALSILVMLEGEVDITINGNHHHLKSKAILDILDAHVVQDIRISADFKGYNIIISKNFMGETMHGIKMIPISNFLNRIKNPIENINDDEASLLIDIIFRIVRNISREEHYSQRDIIKNELRSFFMEVLNIITQKNKNKKDNILNNKENIIAKFIQLINLYCKEQHSVEFYANELCIDAKYLSRILKSLDGRTARTWIDETIMSEAKVYLQDQHLTIQQISDILNFSDQSAFGKFFKKHSGTSPLLYKKEYIK